MTDPLPENPHEWTYATVLRACIHVYELERLEFKQMLKSKPADGGRLTDRVSQCACAMANTTGGHMLFGVTDDRGSAPAGRIVGIPRRGDVVKEFGESIGRVEPNVLFDAEPVTIPGNDSEIVLVVGIALSPRRPHYFGKSFWKRTQGGTCETMNLLEVREQMLLGEDRRRKLTLLGFELRDCLEVAALTETGGNWMLVKRFDVSTVRLLLLDVAPILSTQQLTALLEIARFAGEANRRLDLISGDGRKMVNDFTRFINDTNALLGRIRERVVGVQKDLGTEFPELV